MYCIHGYFHAPHSYEACYQCIEMINREMEQIQRRIHDGNKNKGKEIVICAAIRMKDGYIIRGHRHADCFRTADRMKKYRDERPHGDDQGFVTSQNRYVNRKEGVEIQKAAGIRSILCDADAYRGGELYSEDLY